MNEINDIFAPSKGIEGQAVMLVDSDTICFRAAAATDGRQYQVGKTAFKYKSDAVTHCEANEIPLEDIEIDFYPEPISHAMNIVKGAIVGVRSAAVKKYGQAYKLEFYHTGKRNFRHDLVPDYKDNRADSRKPFHLNECKDYVRKKYVEFTEEGYEADDLIGIRAHELRRKGIPYSIVSNDKDLKTIPGDYYNWVNKVWFKSSTAEATKFFYAQCIAGDETDNIPGVSGLSINNKGTGKAQKIIQKACEDAADLSLSPGEMEEVLYWTAFNCWLEGGPGKKGSFGCNSYDDIHQAFTKSAQCLFILHDRDKLWMPPVEGWRNYD